MAMVKTIKNILQINQGKITENKDIFKEFFITPVRSIVDIQYEDSGLWIHGTIISYDDHNHNKCSYRVPCQDWHIIIGNGKHVRMIPQ